MRSAVTRAFSSTTDTSSNASTASWIRTGMGVQDEGTDKPMKIAIIGQQDFGKTVLEAFLNRGDEVAAVFCAPEKEGSRPDALRAAAQDKGLKVHRFKSLRDPEATQA